jgi:hypothetical protein
MRWRSPPLPTASSLGRQPKLLRTGIRTLGGALIGAATVGGLER